MKQIISFLILFVLTALVFAPTEVLAAHNIPFTAEGHAGYYTNLYGGGADLDGNIGNYSGNSYCSTGNGTCFVPSGSEFASGNVQRYVCNGRTTNCDNAHGGVIFGPTYATAGYIADLTLPMINCNQTVQLDLFKNAPSANDNPIGFMTWYSGDCAAAPTPTPAHGDVLTCKGYLNYTDFINQLHGANYPGPWDDASAIAAYNRAACPVVVAPTPTPVVIIPTPTPIVVIPTPTPVVIVPTATPTPTAIPTPTPSLQPTPTPAVAATSTVQCPAGTTTTITGSTIVCVSQSQVATATTGPVTVTNTNTVNAPVPQVVQVAGATEVKELPKTGLPLSAASLTGLFPIGVFLKRFNKGKKVSEESAAYLWQLREFLKK